MIISWFEKDQNGLSWTITEFRKEWCGRRYLKNASTKMQSQFYFNTNLMKKNTKISKLKCKSQKEWLKRSLKQSVKTRLSSTILKAKFKPKLRFKKLFQNLKKRKKSKNKSIQHLRNSCLWKKGLKLMNSKKVRRKISRKQKTIPRMRFRYLF